MFNRRVQHSEGAYIGQIKVFRWITVRRFLHSSDAVKWLGYDTKE